MSKGFQEIFRKLPAHCIMRLDLQRFLKRFLGCLTIVVEGFAEPDPVICLVATTADLVVARYSGSCTPEDLIGMLWRSRKVQEKSILAQMIRAAQFFHGNVFFCKGLKSLFRDSRPRRFVFPREPDTAPSSCSIPVLPAPGR